MKRKKKNWVMKHPIYSSLIFVGFLLIIITIFSSDTVTFSFSQGEGMYPIEGSVYFDGNYFGTTKNGEIDVPYYDEIPEEITFVGKYKGKEFEIFYDFPKDYYEYYENEFIVSEEDLGIKPFEQTIDFSDSGETSIEGEDEPYNNYPNISELHWGKMPINYHIVNPEDCGEKIVNQINEAFGKIENETEGIISFVYSDSEQGISIECFDRYDRSVSHLATGDTFADAGVDSVYLDGEGNVIYGATIRLFKVTKGNYYGRCGDGYPDTIVHEILHLFGFDDNGHPSSIMYMYIGGCHTEIDEDILQELNNTYNLN